jgi:glycosyltransferase involved in cell wall biosynthesis
MRILFFTESMTCGGKERRILELIQYLKQNTDYEIALVLTENIIQYQYVHDLGIPIIIIKREGLKYDPRPFVQFYRYCSYFKPDILHTWERITTFYAIPAKVLHRIPMISSMIADTRRDFSEFSLRHLFFRTGVFFSNVILSNSRAGLDVYKVNGQKARVICNGVHLDRFEIKYDIEKEREKLKVTTKYMLVMVASFSTLKDWDLFLNVAREINKNRDDVTFVGVGDGPEWKRINQRINDEAIENVVLTGKKDDVEYINGASDLGLLCTYSEGISNSIIECMAMGKPAISTDLTGGSREIITDGETGYCLERNSETIAASINYLLNNPEVRLSMGKKARERIISDFSIGRMGKEFDMVYKEVIGEDHKSLKVSN